MAQNQVQNVPVQSSNPVDVMVDLRRRIEHTFRTRHAPRGTLRSKVEDRVKHHLSRVWVALKARPIFSVVLFSGSTLALANVVGVGELVVTLAVAYAAYLVFSEGVPVREAANEAVRLMETA